jgi:hypothetical protein
MPDFFISYTSADKAWAEWVGFVLEEEGATVVLQAWDFAPGSNFVLEMQRAAAQASRTIAILSPDYLKSRFAPSEWAAAFANDPEGMERLLVPVRVRDCSLTGLLKPVVYIDLVGLDEQDARKRLLDGLYAKRAKPTGRPVFPGRASAIAAKAFPGETSAAPRVQPAPYMPRLRGAVSDLDRTRFLKQCFQSIRAHFESALAELGRQPRVDVEFTDVSATKFTAQAFVDGKRRAQCKVWLGGMMGENQIAYFEGNLDDRDNTLNEALTVSDGQDELVLSALMKMSFRFVGTSQSWNLDRLSIEQACEYLWRHFAGQLE